MMISSQQKRFSYIKDRDSIKEQVFEEKYPSKLKGNLGSVWDMKLKSFQMVQKSEGIVRRRGLGQAADLRLGDELLSESPLAAEEAKIPFKSMVARRFAFWIRC